MAKICPKCGFENIDQTFYCSKCGDLIDKLPERPKDDDPEFLEKSMKARARASTLNSVSERMGYGLFGALLGIKRDPFPRTTVNEKKMKKAAKREQMETEEKEE